MRKTAVVPDQQVVAELTARIPVVQAAPNCVSNWNPIFGLRKFLSYEIIWLGIKSYMMGNYGVTLTRKICNDHLGFHFNCS
jgi:hypothetical protein